MDYVFHLAAKEYFYRSEYDPEQDLQFNALPILRLLEVCRVQTYRPKIVFASSANLFGLVDTLPVNEDNRDNPLTMWAVHKLTAENYLRLYAQQFGIQSITLRLANVYGPTARWSVMDRVVINKVIAKALDGEALVTYANQSCVRDYVFLDDVVSAFMLAGTCCGSTRNLSLRYRERGGQVYRRCLATDCGLCEIARRQERADSIGRFGKDRAPRIAQFCGRHATFS